VREVIDAYMLAFRGKDASRAQRLALWRERIGHIPLVDLTRRDVKAVIAEMRMRPPRFYMGKDADNRPILKAKSKVLAPATVNRIAAALSAALTWAIHEDVAPDDWQSPMRGIKVLREDNARVRFLDDDERERLLAACKTSKWPKLYLLVLLALTTGARRGELQRLRWAHIDFERSEAALVEPTKNGSLRVLPLTESAIMELKRHEGEPGDLIFASPRKPTKAYTAEPVWKAALRAAHIADFHFHDLRHTAASYLAMGGATLHEVGQVLGHKSVSMSARYAHLATGHKSALVNKVLGGIK
jgi:integrase